MAKPEKTEKTEAPGTLLFSVKSAGYYKRGSVELTLTIGDVLSMTPEQFETFPASMKDKLVPVQEVAIRKPLGE